MTEPRSIPKALIEEILEIFKRDEIPYSDFKEILTLLDKLFCERAKL